ncbi:Light-independent protochlorophyllide reductase subunit B [Frankliniella fusca]|uniref:Light-independent protochlorophyllide reductase subunit B n=1 Tax=Frankliniella fusca TaxID=407009 RepID=A0AAE1GVC6_9NEOP|nr:Light-independent protochlorophyllide reductase subunit B [Frankliniella fusca]
MAVSVRQSHTWISRALSTRCYSVNYTFIYFFIIFSQRSCLLIQDNGKQTKSDLKKQIFREAAGSAEGLWREISPLSPPRPAPGSPRSPPQGCCRAARKK